MMSTSRMPRALVAAPAILAALALAGCGASSGGSASTSGAAGTSPAGSGGSSAASGGSGAGAAALPASIKQGGSITVGINAIFAPMEFTDPGSSALKGFDVDFANAIGKTLGVTMKFQNQQFDQLIPSLTTHRVDMVLSGITDNKEREKTLDFIDYFTTGTQAYVLASKAGTIKSLADLCGQTMAISASTDYVTTMQQWSQNNCAKNGKPAIKVLGVDSEPSARLQMAQGRAVASAIGPEVLAYLNTQEGNKYAPVGPILNPGPYGIAFTKNDTQLRNAVMAAVKQLFDNGTYKSLLSKWHLDRDALSAPTIDQATS